MAYRWSPPGVAHLYHGTRAAIAVGAVIQPAIALGASSRHRAPTSDERLISFATDSLPAARLYADTAPGDGRPLVYEVAPVGDYVSSPLGPPMPPGREFRSADGWQVIRVAWSGAPRAPRAPASSSALLGWAAAHA